MRKLKQDQDGFVFQLSGREKEMFLTLVRLYPQIPSGHFKLTRGPKPESSGQGLLDEALAEQRSENQRQVQQLLADPGRWVHADRSWRLRLKRTELEWLLQVLNDIRVGSWILLGSPPDTALALSEENAPHFWAMEVAGGFEAALLEAMTESPGA